MNKYVIAYLSLNDGELKQEIVEAQTKFDAMISYLGWAEDKGLMLDINGSIETIQEHISNMDSYINAIEIQNNRKTGMSSAFSAMYGQIPEGQVANH